MKWGNGNIGCKPARNRQFSFSRSWGIWFAWRQTPNKITSGREPFVHCHFLDNYGRWGQFFPSLRQNTSVSVACVSQSCPESMAWLHQWHQSCCIHLLRNRVQHSHCPFWAWKEASWRIRLWQQARPGDLVSLQTTSASAVGGDAVWGRVSCSEELSDLLFYFPTSVILYSYHFLKFIFHSRCCFVCFFFLMCCFHWRTSGEGSQMEKHSYLFSQFLNFCMGVCIPFNLCKLFKNERKEK